MSDYSLRLRSTGIFGCSGSGKTSLAFRYLQRAPDVVARFIFDDRGQAAARLRLPSCSTVAEMERALPSRWICFAPRGDLREALKTFCAWTYEASQRGAGRKLVFIDEIWRHCSPTSLPPELAAIVQDGRVENLELVSATQRPHKLNESLLGQMTEAICFRLKHRLALKALADLDIEPDVVEQVQRLPLGAFISCNLETGEKFSGKIF